MTGMERLQACIALKSVDRPGLLPSFIDRLAVVQSGLTFADVVERPDEVSAAMRWLWKKLGGYGDAAYYAGPRDFIVMPVDTWRGLNFRGRNFPGCPMADLRATKLSSGRIR